MALVADAGAIYAPYDKRDRHSDRVRKAFQQERGIVVVPAAILGELDYLLREHLGIRAELDFIDSILTGAFTLESTAREDLARQPVLFAQCFHALSIQHALRDLDSELVAVPPRPPLPHRNTPSLR